MTPTQQELEQPVKGYQLLEISNKQLEQDKKLDKIIEQTSNSVTFKDLDRAVQDIKDDLKTEVDIINTRIDNEVSGTKAANIKIFWAILLAIVAFVANEVMGYFKHG